MRASSCRPGTTFVIGGRLAALGAITLRSVIGVKAPPGSPGSESLGGVVDVLMSLVVLVVVRSGLAKQLTSARLDPRTLSTSAQVTAAPAGNGTRSGNRAAKRSILDMTASLQARAGRGRRAVNSVATRNAHYKKRRSPQMASPTTDALTLPLRFRSQRAAFNAATPKRFAFKHAHRTLIRKMTGAETSFDLLNEICRARGDEPSQGEKTTLQKTVMESSPRYSLFELASIAPW